MLHECPLCAGVWLDAETLRHVEDAARQAALPWTIHAVAKPAAVATDWAYRKCPSCNTVMHRRNYGRKSGVVIDMCDTHGVWFDDQELERVLAWLRDGGAERARELDRQSGATRPAEPTPRLVETGPMPVLGRDLRDILYDLLRRWT